MPRTIKTIITELRKNISNGITQRLNQDPRTKKIIEARREARKSIVKGLLEQNYEVLTSDFLNKNEEAIKKLILESENNDDLKILLKKENSRRRNIAHIAAESGNVEILKTLANSGLKHLLVMTENNNCNIAHLAATFGQIEVIEFIARNSETKPLLCEEVETTNIAHCAAALEDRIIKVLDQNPSELKKRKVKILQFIKDDSELKHLLLAQNQESGNIAHMAAAYGNLPVIEFIAKDPDLRHLFEENNPQGYTVRMIAISNGHTNINKFILEHPELNITDRDVDYLVLPSSVPTHVTASAASASQSRGH